MNGFKIGSIKMIGTGYVGLVSGAAFAHLGHRVICLDKDTHKIKKLCHAEIPIFEPGLFELVQNGLASGRLSFCEADTFFSDRFNFSLENEAQDFWDIFFVAVGTPTDPMTGLADLSAVKKVAETLAPLIQRPTLIVMKSTVPVGTGQKMAEWIRALNSNASFEMVSNPEFLREGSAVYDFMNPDRIIIGRKSKKAQDILDFIYGPLIKQGVPIVHTDLETAELIKYTANCFLATKIAFMNEVSELCEHFKANIEQVVEGIGLDKRIGKGYLQVGPGYGGSCFPKDTLALASIAHKIQKPLTIVDAVINANQARKLAMVQKILDACGGSVAGKRIALLGIAFKANTDDVRDSAALTILQKLCDLQARVNLYDPIVKETPLLEHLPIEWQPSLKKAVQNVEAIVIATEWDEFKNIDFEQLQVANHSTDFPTVIDFRNLYDPKELAKLGIQYVSLGRPTSLKSHYAIA